MSAHLIDYGSRCFVAGYIWLQSQTLWRIWAFVIRKFKIGNIEVSVTSFLVGVLVLVLSLLTSRVLRSLIERRIAKRQYIDPGIRYTVARMTQYLVLALGILTALKLALSLDLTSIAVVFTALSVGIGFGLQYIASDIASGFILLFERPIRVGDRVTIGADEGDVQSINLRTTIVTTNDRISVIVPNSKLIRERVVNWSYGDPRARIAAPVSVAPDSDIRLVTTTLLHAAEGVDDVLKQPEPKVQLLRFGDSSLDFRLLLWTSKPRSHMQIRSDINYRIASLFREAGIEIPSPQLDVRLRGSSVALMDNDDLLIKENEPDHQVD